MNQVFATNPTAQALIEVAAIKENPKWKKTEEESLKQAKAAHSTHKESIKKLLSHITAAVENHGKDAHEGKVNWGHTGSLHHVHNQLLDIHKFLSPNRYQTETTAVKEEKSYKAGSSPMNKLAAGNPKNKTKHKYVYGAKTGKRYKNSQYKEETVNESPSAPPGWDKKTPEEKKAWIKGMKKRHGTTHSDVGTAVKTVFGFKKKK